MSRPILVVDDFHPDPAGLREKALASGFQTVQHGGHDYPGVCLCSAGAEKPLEAAVGFPVHVDMEFCRISTPDIEPTTYIHADNGHSALACVLYLSPENHGGTAFWRHSPTGWAGIPPEGISQAQAVTLQHQGMDESFWVMEDLVEMRINRAVIYPTTLFHSRYPNEGFGTNNANGRLAWCGFFSRKDYGS